MASTESIFDGVMEYAISIHIEDGESKEELLKKFDGDKVKLIQWLRERAYGKPEPVVTAIVESSQEIEVKKAIPASLIPKQKRTNKKKVKPDETNKNQNSIF
jgi:uncharacterized membrane protein YcaP (DUF421 family)